MAKNVQTSLSVNEVASFDSIHRSLNTLNVVPDRSLSVTEKLPMLKLRRRTRHEEALGLKVALLIKKRGVFVAG